VARKRRKDREAEGSGEEAAATPQERARLTPVDVQQKVFRLAFRGYNERDVDEFLDRVTEDLAALHEENKRLREQVAEGGAGAETSGAERQAEAIVRQAREHAARLVEEAERRAAATSAGTAAPGLPGSFLLQERQFLQQMASLIQGHAQRLREEARRARSMAEEPPRREELISPARPEASGPAAAAGAAAVGGAAAAGGAAVADQPPSTRPEQPVPPTAEKPSDAEPPPSATEPPPPEEATAPWSPIEERSAGEGEGSSAEEQGDQLVSAWESAFSGDAGERGSPEEGRREDEGEPSLRELFWGEE
jgi:DivIVA domain-containing protein